MIGCGRRHGFTHRSCCSWFRLDYRYRLTVYRLVGAARKPVPLLGKDRRNGIRAANEYQNLMDRRISMLYNNREVFTPDNFGYDLVQVGDYVTQEVVDDAMDCLPPACMTSECSQMGEPYSHRMDPNTGKWRATYATFRRATSEQGGIWEYRGHCFRGETTERGREPVYVPASGEGGR